VAQNYDHEFGEINNEEIQLQRYDKDPSAEAVVIYDIGKSFFSKTDEGFDVFFERRMKIKIFNKAGLKWAQISIPYYEEGSKFEEIYELKANTYNFENGVIRKTELNPDNAYKEKYNEHWFDKKFAMPDVKEGSIIEISYKIRSPYIFNFRNWDFQAKIPVIYSEYTTKMIPFYEYTFLLQGATRFDDYKKFVDTGLTNRFENVEYQDLDYVYVMKNIPAFKDETFITTPNDYIIKLNFQLSAIHLPSGATEEIISTWPKLSEELIDNEAFGKYIKSCKKRCIDIIDTMRLTSKPTLEKVKSIEHFVKSNFNWDGISDKYASKSVKEFLTGKTGNSADINLFMAGMLNAAGIQVNPVILSTRNHGKIKSDYPFLHFFNYVVVIAKIDSISVLLDATEPLSNFTEIPARCLNDKGLIIQKKDVEWVSLKSNSVSSIAYVTDLRFNQSKDSITQKCKLITTGYEAIDYRNKFSKSYKKLKDNLLGNNSLSGDTLLAVNLNRSENPFEVDFSKKTQVENVEDKIIISPFCDFVITENPFKQSVRNYPVDFIYKKAYKYQSTISIPKGYKLLTKPEDLTINNNLVLISFSTINHQDNDMISVTGTYEFKKDEYGKNEYPELKNLFDRIVNKFNEKLILVKGQ
jgi:hypothetical protein